MCSHPTPDQPHPLSSPSSKLLGARTAGTVWMLRTPDNVAIGCGFRCYLPASPPSTYAMVASGARGGGLRAAGVGWVGGCGDAPLAARSESQPPTPPPPPASFLPYLRQQTALALRWLTHAAASGTQSSRPPRVTRTHAHCAWDEWLDRQYGFHRGTSLCVEKRHGNHAFYHFI